MWLPPLEEPPTVNQLLPSLVTTPERGLHPADHPALGKLVVPVALVDKPFEQRRDVMYLDFSAGAGHGLVVGGPQSGKSTLIRSAIASFALTHTPAEVQFYCLDFGGGGMLSLEGLPHVGGVATRLEPDRVRRTIAEVSGILERREEFFRAHGIDSVATYRRRRAAGEFPDEAWGDVFLVIDGYGTFRSDYEQLDGALLDLAARGLGFGVHLVLGAARYHEVRPALRDQLLNRVELRLGDPSDSELDRREANNVPVGRPGRGLSPERLHFLAALPRLDGVAESRRPGRRAGRVGVGGAGRVAGTGGAAGAGAARGVPGGRTAGTGGGEPGVAFGMDETTLSPAFIDFETDPLLVIYGESESGKSSLLRLLLGQLAARYPTQEALMVVADYRRSLLDGLPDDHVTDYCTAAPRLDGASSADWPVRWAGACRVRTSRRSSCATAAGTTCRTRS
ncbi:type VII secretion protein EccCb [Streptomyces albulus]|nr:type VII secretion protein EccCb [Streptomyces noursei]